MGDPRVSVVIPTYNRADIVGRAIRSVLNQSLTELELIVVDDASEDETPAVVRSFEDDRLRYIRHVENKYGRAWNTGIANARTEYIAFLDDDDEWYPEKLKKQVRVIEDAPEDVALVYCWREVYEYGEVVNEAKPEMSGKIFEETIVSNPIGNTSTFLIDADVLRNMGGFDESLPCGLDTDLLRRITKEYQVDYVPEVLVKQHWKHEHEQITDTDEDSIYDTIASHKTTLEKFESYLERDPEKRAKLYAVISRLYSETEDWHKCLYYALLVGLSEPLSSDTHSELYSIGRKVAAELGVGRYVPRSDRG